VFLVFFEPNIKGMTHSVIIAANILLCAFGGTGATMAIGDLFQCSCFPTTATRH